MPSTRSKRSADKQFRRVPIQEVDDDEPPANAAIVLPNEFGRREPPYEDRPLDYSMSQNRPLQGPANYVDPVTYAALTRKRKPKKKSKRKKSSRASGGYPVWHPTGDIAGIMGHGGYWSNALGAMGTAAKRMIPEGAFSRLGAAGGGAMGGAWGAKAGSLLGQGIASVAGFGAYDVKANSLVAEIDEGVQIPQFGDMKHATIIRHREFIRDITAAGGTTFTLTSLPLNPGVASVFPWLSTVSDSYDQYQILGMVFEFRTTSSDITSGGALGSVIMSTDYDNADSNYPNKLVMENAQYAVSGKPSNTMVHIIECDPSVTFAPIKFIRSAAVPSGKDSRLYDWGNFQLATVGLPTSTGNIGELWVSYEVALYKPTIQNSLSYNFNGDKFDLPSTISTSHYLSADTTTINGAKTGSTLGGTVQNSTYTFSSAVQVGANFMVQYAVQGAASTITNALSRTLTGCAVLPLFNMAGTPNDNFIAPQSGALACTTTSMCFLLGITAVGASVTITTGTLPGTITGGQFIVTSISNMT